MKKEVFRLLLSVLVLCALLAFRAQTKSLEQLFFVQILPDVTEQPDSSIDDSRDDNFVVTDPEYSGIVKRLYYINLAKNTKRRQLMEAWLQKQPIPYQRVEAQVGTDDDPCPAGAKPDRCRGMVGLSKTNLEIIRNRDTSGLTLVFEDDYYVTKDLLEAVETTLHHVPSDWDIIRWDCVGPVRSSFPIIVNTSSILVFRAAHMLPCKESNCNFCGSTHAMLWRNSSLPKIEQLWEKQPYSDIDCRLVTDKINGYCVNMKLGINRAPAGEKSDITYIQ